MALRAVIGVFLSGVFLIAAAGAGVPADDDVRARLAAVGDGAAYDADAVVVLDATDVLVRPDGIGTAERHRVVKVLREAGIRGQAVQRFGFDPHTNRLELLAVRVHRADGRVEEVPLERLVQQPEPAWGVFWGTQQYLVGVPRLAVGDAVETRSAMTGFNVAYLGAAEAQRNAYGVPLRPPVPGHWHDEVHFWATDYPVVEKRYTVRAPRDKPVQFEVYSGELRPAVLLDGDQLVYTFEKRDLRPLRSEPAMEGWPNVAPKLLLATLPTWEDKSRWLYEVSEPQFEPDDAIRAKVAELIAGCRTDEEKYTALNHWVAENIRYAGTSRGMCEGYTIHDIKETFHDRCGVCKDKAGMLVGMLRVAGFESYLVMTMARQRVDRVPADQFNHAVTCIRQPDGALVLLDPTWMPKSRDNWSKLEPLQHVVYGLPEGKGLAQSPDFPPEDNQVLWRATSALHDARLVGEFECTATGAPENRLRRTLAGVHPDDRHRLFDETFARLGPQARYKLAACTDPLDFSGPLRLHGELEVEDYALGGGPRRYLALPMMQALLGDRMLADLAGTTTLEQRKYGVRLWATRYVRFEETLKLESGMRIVQAPEPADLDGPAAALRFASETRPDGLHYTCELVIKRWTIPPEEYANYREVMRKFEELAGRVVVCEAEVADAQS